MTYRFIPDVSRPLAMLQACPAYQATPLTEIAPVGSIRLLIKDETNRMGLGAFKALGGVYAVGQFLIEQWREESGDELAPGQLTEESVQQWARKFTFVCASAGNHGMAVAKGAQLFNARCRVHLAESVPETFSEKLTILGAEVVRSGVTYEQSMTAAMEDASANGGILLADSSWPDYTRMPALVMEGYTVMAEEMRLAFSNPTSGKDWPTQVFLQAGVGGMAAAIAYEIRDKWEQQPRIVIVEPEAAPCLYQSIRAGSPTTVSGPVSAMGRLDCKEPSLIAFETLKELADDFVCIGEEEAQQATSYLQENGIETTSSGAAGLAGVLFSERLGLSLAEDSIVLAIATEGALLSK